MFWKRSIVAIVLLGLAPTATKAERPAPEGCLFVDCYQPLSQTFVPKGAEGIRPLDIVLLGDSLSTAFHYSEVLGTIWTSINVNQAGGNWFMDFNPASSGLLSLAEQLGQSIPIRAANYATGAAFIEGAMPEPRPAWQRNVIHSYTFREQVDQILLRPEFPDVTLIFIGHNNMDWALSYEKYGNHNVDAYLNWIATAVTENYKKQLDRLVSGDGSQSGAARKKGRSLIVVLGMIDFASYARARTAMEAEKKADPGLYPYLEYSAEQFPSLKPENRDKLAQLGKMTNARLRQMVEALKLPDNVRVEYSDVMYNLNIDQTLNYGRHDALHGSINIHNRWAQAVYRDLQTRMNFLLAPQREQLNHSTLNHGRLRDLTAPNSSPW